MSLMSHFLLGHGDICSRSHMDKYVFRKMNIQSESRRRIKIRLLQEARGEKKRQYKN